MPRILIAFDGSAPARAAVDRTAALLPGAEAVVVSVASGLHGLEEAASSARLALPDDVIRTALARLHEEALHDTGELAAEGAQLAVEAGLRARPVTVGGDGAPWRALLMAARDAGVDAIACGTRGHSARARVVLGSVCSGLVQHAGMPVLVVPPHRVDASGPLLIAFDGSEPAQHAVAAAGHLLPERPAVVLHVWRSEIRHTRTGQALRRAPLPEIREIAEELDSVFEDSSRDEAERGRALAREHGLDARALAHESAEPVAEAVLEAAGDVGAAVIVVGRRGRGAVAAAILGSVSSSILHATDRPVLVVE